MEGKQEIRGESRGGQAGRLSAIRVMVVYILVLRNLSW